MRSMQRLGLSLTAVFLLSSSDTVLMGKDLQAFSCFREKTNIPNSCTNAKTAWADC